MEFTCITLEDLLPQRPPWRRGKINVMWPKFNRFESLSIIKRYKFNKIVVEHHELIISVANAHSRNFRKTWGNDQLGLGVYPHATALDIHLGRFSNVSENYGYMKKGILHFRETPKFVRACAVRKEYVFHNISKSNSDHLHKCWTYLKKQTKP